jgi:spore germination protein GerM
MRKILWLLLLTLAGVMMLSGCPDRTSPPAPAALTLYFADANAEFLIAETREIDINTASATQDELVALVVNQLILGPAHENHRIILPPDTVLNSAKVDGALATVDFSSSFLDDYWGGSAGEIMTIYGLVNSITSLSGIEEVQILIDGAKAETLAGHIEISEPLQANSSLIAQD